MVDKIKVIQVKTIVVIKRVLKILSIKNSLTFGLIGD